MAWALVSSRDATRVVRGSIRVAATTQDVEFVQHVSSPPFLHPPSEHWLVRHAAPRHNVEIRGPGAERTPCEIKRSACEHLFLLRYGDDKRNIRAEAA